MILTKEELSFKWEDAPESSGVYIFFNSKNEIIYVGCSYALRERIRNHVTRYYSLTENFHLGLERANNLRFLQQKVEK